MRVGVRLGRKDSGFEFPEPIRRVVALTGTKGFTMKIVIESIGGVGSRADVGGHELVFDQPVHVQGAKIEARRRST